GRWGRGFLPAAGRFRAGRVRAGAWFGAGRGPGAGLAHPAGAGGAALAGPRLRLQGDRFGAVHLGEDGGDARVQRAAQDPAVEPVRAVPVGLGPALGVTGYFIGWLVSSSV